MALGVFDVLDAATVPQEFSQGRFTFDVRAAPQIVAVEHQKIESVGSRILIVDPTMQRVEIRHPLQVKPNNFSIKNGFAFDLCCCLDNSRITLRPVCTVDREEPYPSITNVDL